MTILDVAAAAGVSRQTVSNAVNTPDRLSPDTLAKVSAEIARLGFRPSRAARTLKQERAGAWGMQLGAGGSHRLESLVGEFLVHLTSRARAHDSHIVPFVAGDHLDPTPAYDDLVASRLADGFVLADTRHKDPRPAHLSARGIPFAAFGRIWDDPEQTRWVDIDGATGVANAVTHLASGGWERIGFLGWPMGSPVGDDRRSGWARATRALDLYVPRWDVETSQDLSHAAASAAPVIDQIGRGGALVCSSDILAVGAREVLAERGWRVGQDFALVGFDDSSLASSLHLTSIRQPLAEVAEGVLDLLGATDSDDPAQGLLLTPELVIRSSSNPRETA